MRPDDEGMRTYDRPACAHCGAKQALADIRGLVDEQAEDEGLWGIVPSYSIVEAHLQQELRRLHALIEKTTS